MKFEGIEVIKSNNLITLNNMSQIENFQLLWPKLTDDEMWLIVMCTPLNLPLLYKGFLW